jgi:hypothetical protein
LNAKQPANIEMLAGLGFDSLIGSNDEQNKVDSAYSRQHVAHEALVARDIDKAQAQALTIWRGYFQVRKSQVNCYSAAFFLFQAVGVDAGHSLDERCLAVIDVAGRAYDDGLHATQYRGSWRKEHCSELAAVSTSNQQAFGFCVAVFLLLLRCREMRQ